jgi:uncharacterized membrane protein YphA (DoxX/SURF4 family)
VAAAVSDVGYCLAVFLAGVFVVAAAAKARTPRATATTFRRLGVPAADVAARAVPVVELLVATVLLAAPRAGAVGALVLLVAFTAVLARAVAGGVDVSCGCFGMASSAPVTPVTLLRNVFLVAAASCASVFAPAPAVPSFAAVVLVSTLALLGAVVVGAADVKRTVGGIWKTDTPA